MQEAEAGKNVIQLDDYRRSRLRAQACLRAEQTHDETNEQSIAHAKVRITADGTYHFDLIVHEMKDVVRLLSGCQSLVANLIRRLPGAVGRR